MVKISKAEKDAILKRYPNAHIRRTMKQDSKRHHYYCEESVKILRCLEDYRTKCSTRE